MTEQKKQWYRDKGFSPEQIESLEQLEGVEKAGSACATAVNQLRSDPGSLARAQKVAEVLNDFLRLSGVDAFAFFAFDKARADQLSAASPKRKG